MSKIVYLMLVTEILILKITWEINEFVSKCSFIISVKIVDSNKIPTSLHSLLTLLTAQRQCQLFHP